MPHLAASYPDSKCAEYIKYDLTYFLSYGERGSVIIQQLLYSMFPPESLSSAVFKPLNSTEFLQRVLLPEAGLQLIIEDQICEEEEALFTMRASTMYGMGMFPDIGDKDEVRAKIVEKRAKKRRKEIAREVTNRSIQSDGDDTWDIDDVGPPTSSLTTTGSSPLSSKKHK